MTDSPLEKVKEVGADALKKLSEEVDQLEKKLQNLPVFGSSGKDDKDDKDRAKRPDYIKQQQQQQQEEHKGEYWKIGNTKLHKLDKEDLKKSLQDLVIPENFNEADLERLHVEAKDEPRSGKSSSSSSSSGPSSWMGKVEQKVEEKVKDKVGEVKDKVKEKVGQVGKMVGQEGMNMIAGKIFVVAVDGSEQSRLAFKFALENSQPSDKLKIIHGDYIEAGVESDARIYEAMANKTLFERLAAECKEKNIDCTFDQRNYSGSSSSLSKGICEYALNNNASSIVVGSRGLSTAKRMVLGSVSSYLVKNCPCSVTVIKKPDQPVRL